VDLEIPSRREHKVPAPPLKTRQVQRILPHLEVIPQVALLHRFSQRFCKFMVGFKMSIKIGSKFLNTFAMTLVMSVSLNTLVFAQEGAAPTPSAPAVPSAPAAPSAAPISGEATAPVLREPGAAGTLKPSKHLSYKELMEPQDPKAIAWDKLKLTDSKGKNFTFENFRGKLVLINFFFAHCPDVCPPQTAGLHRVIQGLGKHEEESIRFVSITIDPDNDSAAKLEEYKKQFSIKSPSWIFARTSKDNLQKLGVQFGSISGDPKKPLDHKARFYLINTDGSFLLSYDSSVVDVPRMTKDMTDAVRTFVKKPGEVAAPKPVAPVIIPAPAVPAPVEASTPPATPASK
jgi:cytochrome oxidase Cu insertion factor (SCO1/SenC/PrrC family)